MADELFEGHQSLKREFANIEARFAQTSATRQPRRARLQAEPGPLRKSYPASL